MTFQLAILTSLVLSASCLPTTVFAEASTVSKKLMPVSITFMEALAPKDTTSSERFQKEYEFSIQTGKDLTKQTLSNCGYELIDNKVLYDASDNLQALEQAKKAEKNNAWMIVGPRRSNHYLLAAQGASNTPSVSIMASSKEVYELNSLHLTMAQSNENMANALADETKSRLEKNKSITYFSIISKDCISCIDFAKSFDLKASKINLNKISEFSFTGEQPSLDEIKNIIQKAKPHFILIPNYSVVSAHIMNVVQSWGISTLYIGSDGWGDSKYGFVHNSPQLSKVNGLTIKGFPPADKGLEYFDLGKQILKNPTLAANFPVSGTAQSILKTMEALTQMLCDFKPKTKEEFISRFKVSGQKYFINPWGVSVFNLVNGEIVFDKTLKVSRK